MKQKRRQREEPCPICQHYHDYEGGEPCSICGHKLDIDGDIAPPSVLPSEIVAGFLFLGSYDHASRRELLKTLEIDFILNTVPGAMNLHKNGFEYYHVVSNPPNLDECCAFLEKVRLAEKKVLVHCMTGTSRSPSIVIYYLMRVHNYSLDAAYSLVKEKRPAVAFSADDVASLQQAEAVLLGPTASRFAIPVGKPGFGGGGAAVTITSPVNGGPQ